MQGYWALPEQTEKGFLPDNGGGKRWYRTGDIVTTDENGDYRYVGRRDRMVKKRGYRIELGEIEACLYLHPEILHAAAVADSDESGGVKIVTHLTIRGDKRPSLIQLKSFCAKHLPLYMVPDSFVYHESMPMTSTGKIDYVSLSQPA